MDYKRTIDYTWSFKQANTKEFTHTYHTYPAMMIPQIARTLISEYKPNGKLNLIFDPYCGSGTTLVEACIAGIDSIGTDLNPLAQMMSKVKTTHYSEQSIINAYNDIVYRLHNKYDNDKVINRCFDRISNYTFWYSEDSLLRLSYIYQLINEHPDTKDFFYVVLSEIVREVSYTRNSEFKRFRMSLDSLKNFNPDVFDLFISKAKRNIAGLHDFNKVATSAKAQIYRFNTVNSIPNQIITDKSVDMVITSPPYGDSRTTVAYGQFSRWSNEWFGFDDAKQIDSMLMGGKRTNTEIFNTTTIRSELDSIKSIDYNRYCDVIAFLNDYYISMKHVAETVRSGGIICYVVGNRTVKGVQIQLDYFTAEAFQAFGCAHIDTIVREIPNKRMPIKTSPTNTKGKLIGTMTNEYIVICKKL